MSYHLDEKEFVEVVKRSDWQMLWDAYQYAVRGTDPDDKYEDGPLRELERIGCMGKTTIRAVVALRGGFRSQRGTYTDYRIGEGEFEGSIEDATPFIKGVLQEAKDKAKEGEIVIWEKIEMRRNVEKGNSDSI